MRRRRVPRPGRDCFYFLTFTTTASQPPRIRHYVNYICTLLYIHLSFVTDFKALLFQHLLLSNRSNNCARCVAMIISLLSLALYLCIFCYFSYAMRCCRCKKKIRNFFLLFLIICIVFTCINYLCSHSE